MTPDQQNERITEVRKLLDVQFGINAVSPDFGALLRDGDTSVRFTVASPGDWELRAFAGAVTLVRMV